MLRRTLLAGAPAAVAAAALLRPTLASAQAPGRFSVPPLTYDYAALEPVVSRETMMLHHDKHHQAYVDNLNKAVAAHPQIAGQPVEAMLRNLTALPDEIRTVVRNNGGGHANHALFWQAMHPGGTPMPDGLRGQIERDLGSVAAMKAKFEDAGLRLFGSGWVFLAYDTKARRTEILSLPNQDSPFMQDGKVPLMGNDVWEHAYYLTYRNRRADYLKAWWDVVNWDHVGKRLDGARAGKVPI